MSNGGVHGVATSGMLWEAAMFWHWGGDSYHEAGNGYVPNKFGTIASEVDAAFHPGGYLKAAAEAADLLAVATSAANSAAAAASAAKSQADGAVSDAAETVKKFAEGRVGDAMNYADQTRVHAFAAEVQGQAAEAAMSAALQAATDAAEVMAKWGGAEDVNAQYLKALAAFNSAVIQADRARAARQSAEDAIAAAPPAKVADYEATSLIEVAKAAATAADDARKIVKFQADGAVADSAVAVKKAGEKKFAEATDYTRRTQVHSAAAESAEQEAKDAMLTAQKAVADASAIATAYPSNAAKASLTNDQYMIALGMYNLAVADANRARSARKAAEDALTKAGVPLP